MNLRDMMFCRTRSSMWKLPAAKVKHCGLVPLTQSEVKVKYCGLVSLTQSKAGSCDQENFEENSTGHDR